MLNKQGVTIIEIITVVIVITLLAAIALPQYMTAIERAMIGKARTRIDAIRKAEAAYFSNYMKYTSVLSDTALPDVPEATKGLTGGSDGEWTYVMGIGSDLESYTVTATRKSGIVSRYGGKKMFIDMDGIDVTPAGEHPLAR